MDINKRPPPSVAAANIAEKPAFNQAAEKVEKTEKLL
jgi:hypothetical protein